MPAQVIALVAPTGAGKTRTLLALRERIEFDVISADSVQAVREFDIGSAKPSPDERARLTHHLIDVVGPDQRYDAGQFAQAAGEIMQQHPQRRFVITAGTGLYLAALTEGLSHLPRLPDQQRGRLFDRVRAAPQAAYAELQANDAAAAAKLHPNDWRRVARHLEYIAATGRPATTVLAEATTEPGCDIRHYGIWAEGDRFEALLQRRIETMLNNGWIEEVRRLQGEHGNDLPMFEAVGYRQIVAMLAEELPRAELVQRIWIATRRYAKRQRTWFRRRPVGWFRYRPEEINESLVAALHNALLEG